MVRGGASASPAGREFEIAYVDAESGARRLALIDAWSVPFEECMPVRGFPSYKGQSLLGLRDGIEPDWWITSEDGQTLLPDNPKHVFYADCPPDVAERAAAALVPQRKLVFSQELHTAAWQTVLSTYVVCTRDNAIPPALQELMAQRAGIVSHLDASHSPFLSRPDEVTAIIQETLAAVVAHV